MAKYRETSAAKVRSAGRSTTTVTLSVLAALASLFMLPALQGEARAQSVETRAEQALIVDHSTGTVLLSKEPDAPVAPASLAKLMTLEVAFSAIAEGRVSLDDEFFVSEYAWRTGGAPSRTATMFAEVNSNVAVSDLLRGIMVQGANDASIVIAEGIAGSEEAFAEVMNERAGELGLTGSRFTNATGLPSPEGAQTTVSDMMRLSRHIIDEYDELYRIFSEPEFTWNGIRQTNRNPLSGSVEGLDGLLAGYAEESGFGIAASALHDNQRIVMVIHGLPSANARISEAQRLFSWARRSFERTELFAAGEVVGEVGVFGGAQGRVPVASEQPIAVLLPRGERVNLRGRIVYTGPLRAPVRGGAEVGVLRLQNDELVISEVPLRATQSVSTGPLHRRAMDAALELLIGAVHSGVEAATSR